MNKKDTNNLFKSFSIMSVLTLISRILGYVRDLFFAFIFGATPLADSFLLAFRIPNFFRRLFAEGAINNAFIPIYLSISNRKDKGASKKFSGSLFLILILGLVFILILGELFMLEIVKFLAPNFTADMQVKTANLASIMFPYLIFISASSFIGAMLNANKRFLMWTFLPIVLNLFMVLGMVFSFQKYLDVGVTLSFSVLLAGFVQLILILFLSRYVKINFIFTMPNAESGYKEICNQIIKFCKKYKDSFFFKSLGQDNYFAICKHAHCIIGNSSSGIIESPSLLTPSLDIGNRQLGRVRAESVINSRFNVKSIIKSIKECIKLKNTKKKYSKFKNPYEKNKTADRIIKVLKSKKLENILLKKFKDFHIKFS